MCVNPLAAGGIPGGGCIYDTEMLSLDLAGGDLPAGVIIRESPTEPSRGSVELRQRADGSYEIHSFFDIFTELTVDGGQTWSPASSGPAHVELNKVATPHPFPSPNLPPPNGQYISPAQWHALYANGIIISNVSHQRFTQNQPPPPPGGSQTHNFGSVVTFMLSMNGGGVWQQVTAPASVSALVRSSIDSGPTRYFDTEMLALNISGGGLPAGVMVRESPSKASLGRTSITPNLSGGFAIDSFFDIFTEVSVDGGQTWSAMVTSPADMGLAPYPLAAFRINCPSNMTVTASSPSGATVNYLVTYLYPDCPFPPFTVTCTPPSGSTFPIGTTTVNCTGSDGCGEHPTCSFTVTVRQQYKILREWFFHDNLLPPLGSVYLPGGGSNVIYANGVILRNLRNHFFTQSFPPPAPGPAQTQSFDSTVEFEHSMDGGNTFQKVSAPAHVSVAIGDVNGDGRTFRTEMLQLDIAGGTLPAGVMVRESPTLQSTGQTTVRPVPGGYMISSFFDVFTELSLDGGNTWSPSRAATQVEMRKDAATVPPTAQPTPLLPPPNGAYISPAQWHALYAEGIVIRDVRHSFFTQSMPPPAGGSNTHSFSSQVDMQLSMDGGTTFRSVRVPGDVTVIVSDAGGGLYDTEMTALTLQGGDLPANVRLRESPTEPSRGATTVEPQPDGSFRVASFFDIFVELSLDGGGTWRGGTGGPVRMELVKPAQPHIFPSPNLPPPNGQYISPAQWHALYANGIIISNVSHQRFTQNQPPPPPGGSQTHNFGSVVTFMLSMNGGGVWQQVTAPASVSALVRSSIDSGPTRYFDTEMLALNISGGGLPAGVMVRESPSKASLGRTSITPNLSGGFAIDSFFDIFTEVSVDGGQTWSAMVTSPADMGLAPYPLAAFRINCPSNMTVTASSPSGATVNYLVTYLYPDCPFPPFTVTCTPPSGSTFPIGTTTVNCTGSDGCGEHPTCSFTVTVRQQYKILREWFFHDNLLPPLGSVYLPGGGSNVIYANGVILRNLRNHFFTQSFPPPAPGPAQTQSFDSTVEFEHSMDGGNTFQKVSAPAHVSVAIGDVNGDGRTFRTEMLQLDIAGGTLPAGVMVRESPMLQSTGQTTVRPITGGYMISSFFDIFTELSLDGGNTWSPARGATQVEMRYDPDTIAPIAVPTNLLPPRNDVYISPALYHQLYASGIVIKDVRHSYFTQSQPPPAPGTPQMHEFDSQVDMMLSMDGGQAFMPMRALAYVLVRVVNLGSSPDDGLFDTEMLALHIHGGDLPLNIMMRESPTLASQGGTQIKRQPDGTYQMSSFFDIFTEVSLDGGQTWDPASNGPVHVEARRRAPENPFPNSNLPPLNGQYVSPQQYHVLYANGIILSNVSHKRFTQSQPPPPLGGSQVHSFGSDVEFNLHRPGQLVTHVTAPASVQAQVSSGQDEGNTRYFDTEMLSLNISGGGLPPGVMVRESPSKASLGRTSIRQAAGQPAQVSSFFDIFTEISLDGGQTWSPQTSPPAQMTLETLPVDPCADPATIQIQQSPGGTSVTISWGNPAFRLQVTDKLQTPATAIVWQDVPGTSPVTRTIIPDANRFYRVICP